MYCKRHELKGRVIYALCDKSLIGRVLKDGNLVIDLDKYRSFYIGNDEFSSNYESINAIGEKSVSFLINRGIIKKEEVKYVGDIPHVQIYKI